MKLYFIAGESSGDLIGAKIISAIKKQIAISGDSSTQQSMSFYGIGGDEMFKHGVKSLFNFQEISLMGFVEVVPHIFRLKKLINQTVEDIIKKNIDVLVTIDCPGFTFRVAQKIKSLAPNIKLAHVVAPSIWAYKESRAKKYAKVYDKLLTLFPFEPPYFTKYGLDAEYIGHPILEQHFYENSKELRKEFNIPNDHKVIAITPGSRKGEISKHMPVIRDVLDSLSSTQKITAIFVQPNDSYINYILKYITGAKFNFIFSTERLKSFAVCDVALAKSGTNTIEITASGKPMIVIYKLNPMTFSILQLMIKVKYASVVNLIANKEIIPEYIQSDFTKDKLAYALTELLVEPDKANAQVALAKKVLKTIGLEGEELPSEKAAKIIIAVGLQS